MWENCEAVYQNEDRELSTEEMQFFKERVFWISYDGCRNDAQLLPDSTFRSPYMYQPISEKVRTDSMTDL